MKLLPVGFCDLEFSAVRLQHTLAEDGTTTTHQTTSTALPEELVEEILLRFTPDEPTELVRATVVCKAWRRILSDDTFRRRYRRFHRTLPLQGYICTNFRYSTVRFVPTTTVAAGSPVCVPKLDDGSSRKTRAVDCRHGRVLIETASWGPQDDRRLIVYDLIAGSQQQLSLPTHPKYPYEYCYTGAVLCVKNGCDHLDCHDGPFCVILAGMSDGNDNEKDGQTWACVYLSETGAWSSPTTPNEGTNKYVDELKPGLHIGDALYFISGGYNIIKYDLCKHELSVMDLPEALPSILIKGNDGGLGVAAMLRTCIYMWSWHVNDKGVAEWVTNGKMELADTLLPKGDCLPDLICMAEGTNTVFIGVARIGVFTIDLRSRQVRKIGKAKTYSYRPILPYMSFSTPKY